MLGASHHLRLTHRQPPRRRPVGGFTLIETIVAVVIITIAMPPMLWAVREGHQQRVNPVFASTARWLAVEKLEDIIADRHSTTRGWNHLVGGNYPAEAQVAGFEHFNRSVTLNEHGPWNNVAGSWSAGAGYMTVTVTVQYTDAAAEVRSLSVSSVLTEYE